MNETDGARHATHDAILLAPSVSDGQGQVHLSRVAAAFQPPAGTPRPGYSSHDRVESSRPDPDHADESTDGGERSNVANDGTHGFLPLALGDDSVLVLFSCQGALVHRQ
jgi:hypothetical protein